MNQKVEKVCADPQGFVQTFFRFQGMPK